MIKYWNYGKTYAFNNILIRKSLYELNCVF